MIRFDVDPRPRPRMTRRDKWKKRPSVEAYFAYRDALQLLAMNEGWKPSDALRLRFVVPMPKSWTKNKKRRLAGEAHQQRPDLDNYIKGFLDAFGEDKHVWWVKAEKRWAGVGEDGYVEAKNLEPIQRQKGSAA